MCDGMYGGMRSIIFPTATGLISILLVYTDLTVGFTVICGVSAVQTIIVGHCPRVETSLYQDTLPPADPMMEYFGLVIHIPSCMDV